MEESKVDNVEEVTEEAPTTETKLNKGDILQIISNALKIGSISSRQAAGMRAEMGIFGSDFTKKKTTSKQRKARRKAQQRARAVTRKNGYKGQKSPSGRNKRIA